MKFEDDDGSIIVPKSVRPIIEYTPTALGSGSGALRQYRAGKLHIREYDNYYTVHSDKIDPLNDPLGHLIIDAPEYLVGLVSGISIYLTLKERSITEFGPKDTSTLAGIFGAYAGYAVTKSLKKLAQRRG
ncbi:MAG: hypothetical protein WBX01_05075 [Nitrososphaeraceae archaeon]